MRILLTVHAELDPDAGASGVICSLANAYRAAGHDVTVHTLSDLPARLPGKLKQALFPWWLAARLHRDAAQYDVIDASTGDAWIAFGRTDSTGPLKVTHSHGLDQLLAVVEREEAVEAGRRRPVQTVLWRHGLRLREVSRSLRLADLCLTLNEAERRFLVEVEGVAPDRIEQVRYGTPLANGPEPTALGPVAAVAQIGSYTRRKGVDLTAAAMLPVLRRHPDVELRFLGTGVPAERVLADYPADVHGQIRVIPRFRNDELPGLLAGAGIQLMPSRFEGYGVVKLESMACGLVPIVSDDPGSMADIRHEANGIVVPNGDAAALEAAVERLLVDPALRARLAATAMTGVAGWPMVAEERLDAYRRHLERLRISRS